MNNRSEPGYTRERNTAVRMVPGADFHSEPGARMRSVEFERPAPVDVSRRPNIYRADLLHTVHPFQK